MVILAGRVLPPAYSFLAASVGSAMADVFSGYAVYAPVTFVIKGIMAAVVSRTIRPAGKTFGKTTAVALCGGVAEIIMVAGYLRFENAVYGFAAGAVNVVPNCIQAAGSLCMAVVIYKGAGNKI